VEGVVRAFAAFMDSGPGLWAWLFALVVVAGRVTFVHELGHAIAARRLLPGRVLLVVGLDRRRRLFQVGGIDFAVSPLTAPVGLAGECLYEGLPSAREAALIAAAGPAATGVGFLVALGVYPHTGGLLHSLFWMAVFMQGFGLVLNLVPLTYTQGGRAVATDGRTIADALRHTATPRPQLVRLQPAAPPAPVQVAASPVCARCGHGRDEHVDLLTGRRGSCLGQHDDFQSLSSIPCDCAAFVPLASPN
jgi:hypothetical protein